MKVLYVYSGSRKDKFRGTAGVDFPDTQFYGWNHLKSLGIDADYLERDDALPGWLRRNTFTSRVMGFRAHHLFTFFATRRYDVVFGSSLLYMMILKKILKSRAQYVLLNIGLTRTLRAHANHPFRRRILISLMKELDAIVCLSQVQKDWLESRYPFLSGKVYFVPLGVDANFYQPVFEGRGDFVLSVGRDNGRDYGALIAAARRLPETRFEIVCSRRNLQGVADIPHNVTVFYDLPLSEVVRKYRTARLMVLSTHDDTFADGSDCSGQTVLLDAMANGLPVIATDKAYLKDYVHSGESALVIVSGDPDAMVAGIQSLSSAHLARTYAENARREVEARFQTKSMAAALVDVFRSVLQ